MSIVKNTVYKLGVLSLAVLVMVIVGERPAHASGGFRAELDTPPLFLSPYDEPMYEFSVALCPRTQPLLSQRLKKRPKVIRESFSDNSFTFNTVYFRNSGLVKEMIPVSVDANNYMSYRIDKTTDDKFYKLTTKSITNSDKEKRHGGLGVSVALPKRLDRVFGEGGAALKVAGMRKITFAGRSQWNDAASTDTYQKSKFPSLNMEQISRFDITGTIGSKISVTVSQDSQTDIPLANRIKIRYKGDEDDILKAIEAGNTTLNLPNTRFVGYSSNIRGLFGIKTEAQLGSMKLTAIASQEKGTS
ncbi:MAG: hypothetical protein U9R56_01085, partial [candidate division Zixibacteria bacterium]|nr:hypothetical protein [candidate division Zixibacteria bacterium]